MDILNIILPFLAILTVLVFVHEMGHYLIARRNSVRVEVFSVGFGKEIFGWTDKTGTRWKFCLIPLGGYVKMFGDTDASSMNKSDTEVLSPEDLAVSFHHKKLNQRAAIVVAGPLANFLFAIVLLTGLYSIVGQRSAPPVIDRIENGSVAELAGLRTGDEIIQVDNQVIDQFNQLQRIVRPNPGKKLVFLIKREKERLSFDIIPRAVEMKDASGGTTVVGLIGVGSERAKYVRHNPITSVRLATMETWSIISQTVVHVAQMVRGDRNTEELGGPIRIAKLSGAVAEAGLVSSIWFMAVLSINLGLINLFPVPVLDGGHLVFYLLEFVRGKPIGEKAQQIASTVGVMLVLALMVFATWNDLVHMNVFSFFASFF